MDSSCSHRRYSTAIVRGAINVTSVVIEFLVVPIENAELLGCLSEYCSQIHVSLGNFHFSAVILTANHYHST